MKRFVIRSKFTASAGLLLALLLGACSADSPTAPERTPPPANGGGGGTAPTAWSITVSADPNRATVAFATTLTSNVTVTVRRTSDGALPPDGTTVILGTSAGTLTSSLGTGTSVATALTGGVGVASFSVPSENPSTITLQAQLEQSVGQETIRLLEAPPPPIFIVEEVTPSTGPVEGRRVNIRGQGFEEPVRVFFGSLRGEVISVGPRTIVAQAPPIDELAANTFLTVDVSVTINVNDPVTPSQTDTLTQGFTYVGETVDIPSITSLTPTSGPNEGGTIVTVFGEGFSREVQLFFGTATTRIEAEVINVSSTQIRARTPSATGFNAANANSLVDVRVRNLDTGLQSTLTQAFQYGTSGSDPVVITSVGPNEGPYFGGFNVTVFGRGFEEPVAVGLGAFASQIISVSGTEIIVRAPRVQLSGCADESSPTSVTNIETGETAGGPNFTFRALGPAIFDVSPTVSSSAGGGTVTVTGSNIFGGEPYRLLFGDSGDEAAAGNIVVADGVITATIPGFAGMFDEEECDDDGDGTTGNRFIPTRVDVTLINLATSCDDVFSNAFTYNPTDASCRGDAAPPPAPVAPTALFQIASQNNGTGVVSFANLSTPGDLPVSYSWLFQNGNPLTHNANGTAGAPTPNPPPVTFPGSGTYTVTLQASNAGGSSTATLEVVIP